MKNTKNKKINWKEVYAFLKTPRGKAFAFFGFYLIFFIAIMIMARVGGSSNLTSSSYQQNTLSYDFSTTSIENSNYHFKYEYNLDQNSFVYEGDKYGYRELFVFGGDKYYRSGDNYLKDTDGIWIKIDNPYVLPDFLDINIISNILKEATYISKTDYDSGVQLFNFQVSTNTLVKVLENVDIDIDDLPNEIVLSTDTKGNVNNIKFNLDSYCKYKQISSLGNITLSYSKFGEIEEINVKIDD